MDNFRVFTVSAGQTGRHRLVLDSQGHCETLDFQEHEKGKLGSECSGLQVLDSVEDVES